jgi:hypothetical protein
VVSIFWKVRVYLEIKSDLSVITSHLDSMAGWFAISRGALLENIQAKGVWTDLRRRIRSERFRLNYAIL